MGMLQPLIQFKDKLAELILSDERVVSLINEPEYSTVPAIGLKYRNVFPFAYVPTTVDNAKAIICYEAVVNNVNTDTVCDVGLTIWVMCHTSIEQTDEGCRHDVLADAIDDLINHSRDFGIGKLTPVTREPVQYSVPNYDYICRKLQYVSPSLNFRFGARD